MRPIVTSRWPEVRRIRRKRAVPTQKFWQTNSDVRLLEKLVSTISLISSRSDLRHYYPAAFKVALGIFVPLSTSVRSTSRRLML